MGLLDGLMPHKSIGDFLGKKDDNKTQKKLAEEKTKQIELLAKMGQNPAAQGTDLSGGVEGDMGSFPPTIQRGPVTYVMQAPPPRHHHEFGRPPRNEVYGA